MERTPNPSEHQIDELHSKYIEALIDLFERHKAKYYPTIRDLKLTIV